MISIITSLNSPVQKLLTRKKEKLLQRKTIFTISVVTVFLFLTNFSVAQAPPQFDVCPGAALVTLADGGQDAIVFTTDNIPTLLGVMASDPDGAETVTYSASPASVDCSDVGAPVVVNVTASDSDGDNSTCFVTVTVSPGAPLAVCMDITVMVDGGGTVTVFPSDINGGSLSCTPLIPANATINGAASVIYTCADIGTTQTADLVVDNGTSLSAPCTANITVMDDIDPTFTCPADLTVSLNGSCQLVVPNLLPGIVDEDDNCSPPAPLMTQSPTAGTVIPSSEGATTMVTVTAEDAHGNTSSCMVTVTSDDDTPPNPVCQDITVSLDQSGSYTLTAAEIDGGSTDNCGTTNISIPATTFGCGDIGDNFVTLTVDDGNGNSDNCIATVTVEDGANSGPVFANCPTTINAVTNTGSCETTVGWLSPSVSDACSGIASFTVSAVDEGGNPIALTTGGTPASPPCVDIIEFAGYYNVANWTTVSGTVNTGGAPASIDLSSIFLGPPSVFRRTVEYDGVISFDWNSVGSFFGFPTFEYALNGTTVQLSGGVLTSGSVEVVVSAGDVFDFIQNPGIIATPTTTVSNFAFTCEEGTFGTFPEGTNTVTYTATDGAGNTEICEFEVIVTDAENPTIGVIADQTLNLSTLDCEAPVVPDYTGLAVTADNCGVASVTQTPAAGSAIASVTNGSTFNVTLEVTDVNGNDSDPDATFTVTINDNVAPTTNTCPSPIVVQIPDDNNGTTCTATATWPTPTFDDCGDGDGSGDAFAGTFISRSDGNAENDPFDLADSPVTVTYRYTDAAGNSEDCAFTVTVQDVEGPQFNPVPADINVNVDPGECFATVTWPAFSALDCSTPVSFTSSHNSGDQFPEGVTTVTVTATDAAGNDRTVFFDVQVTDNEAPTPVCQDITVNLDASGNASINGIDLDNGSSDNCTGVTFSFQSTGNSTLDLDCDDVGDNVITLVVSDGNGNTATCTPTVTVEDNVGPTITCPADVTVSSAGSCDAFVTVDAPVLNDNCTATATNDYNGTADASDTYPNGTTVVTWTVDDGNGNTTTCTMNVTVEDDEDPFIVCPTGSSTVQSSTTVNVSPGLTIPDDCSGTLEVTIPSGTLDDPGADIEELSIQLDIEHSWIGDLSATLETPDGDKVTLFARPGLIGGPIDPDDTGYFCNGCCGYNNGSQNISLTFETGGLSSSVLNNINNDGDLVNTYEPVDPFAGLAGGTAEGDYILTIYDGVGGDLGTLDNVSLTIDYNYTVVTTDLDRTTDPGVCTFSIVGTDFDPPSWGDNCPGATLMHNLPPTIAPDPTTLDGAVLPVGLTNVTWTVTDASGNTNSCSIGITVTDEDAPVQTAGQADGTTINVNAMGGGCTASVNWVAPTFTDNCLDPVIPSSTHTPGSVFSVGTTTVEYVATDPSGNTTVVSFTVIVTDGLAPNAGCQPNPINLVLDGTGFVTLTALDVNLGSTDNCGIETYEISVDGNPFAPDFTFSCTDLGTFPVVLRVSDGTFTDECNATVIVSDVTAPVAVCQDITVSLDGSGNATINFQQIDNGSSDNGQACLSLSLNQTSFDCDDLGPNTVTLTASDAGGNTDACTATVTVIDDLAPTINAGTIPPDVTVSCNTTLPGDPGTITATDNCDVPVVNYSETSTQSGNPANCANYNYTFTQTWTASDNSSNSSSLSRVITVVDTQAPGDVVYGANVGNGNVISTNPNDCFASINLEITNLDDCAPFANITITNDAPHGDGAADASGDYAIGTYNITFTATDPCGNVATFNYSFSVEDQVAPVASCVNNLNLGLPSSGILVLSPNAIDNNSFDNCGVISLLEVTPDTFTCADVGMTIPVTLTVHDDAGNSSSCNTSVTIQENNNPTALCQPTTLTLGPDGTVSLNASDVDAGSFDDCTPVSLSVSPNMFDETNLGSGNIVTLTVTDDHGNVSTCTANVTVQLPPTCFEIGNIAGGAGEIVSVPVTSEDFAALVGFQFELGLDTEETGEFIGLSGINPELTNTIQENLIVTDSFISQIDSMVVIGSMGQDSTVFDTIIGFNFDLMSISWNQFNTNGMGDLLPVTFPDGTVLFNVDILLTGNIGDNSEVSVNAGSTGTPPEVVYSFSSGFIPAGACVNSGFVSIGQLIIAGDIYNENGNGISLVDVDLFDTDVFPNQFISSVQTGPDGHYEFTVAQSGDFLVIPQKNINWSNGIDILDVSLIQRHSVGNPYVNSAYKKIAADVSGEGSITTFDAVLLNAYLASLFMDPPPPTPSWQFSVAADMLPNDPNAFVPLFSNTIPLNNISSDTSGNDFIAVKTGDLGGLVDADTLMFGGDGTADPLNSEMLTFTLEDKSLKAGEQVSIDFTADNFKQLVAYQWILDFDQEVLNYTGFDNINLENLGEIGFGEVILNEGKLVLTWFNGRDISKNLDDVLFSLNFEVKEDAMLSELFSIYTHENMSPVAYDVNDEPRVIDLIFTQPEVRSAEFALYQNIPNPFKDQTVISFNLPEATDATITIMDVTGRVLKQYEGNFIQGYNEISVDRGELPQAGTLIYELKTPDHVASMKMIIID